LWWMSPAWMTLKLCRGFCVYSTCMHTKH
jgi:hypothetical protein